MEPPRKLLATLRECPSHALTEDEIALLWKFICPRLRGDDSLSTIGGSSVTVVNPGSIGHPEGPDVRGATVTIGNDTRSGDVEIHAEPADWYHHGHHRNPTFNNVILHVCMTGSGESPTRREDGCFVETVRLESIYDRCLDRLDEVLDREDQSRLRAVKRPCYVPDQSVPEDFHKDLDLAGQGWLMHRSSTFGKSDRKRSLFEAIVGSLGYTRNHENFSTLAKRIDRQRFYHVTSTTATVVMEAWLMGKAGWLKRPFKRGMNRTIYRRRECWETRWQSDTAVMDPSEWNHSGIRPQAFPLRRWIWFGYATRHLTGTWTSWLSSNVRPLIDQQRLRAPVSRKILSLFHMDRSRYWARHYTRRDDPHDRAPSPFGSHWEDQFVVNVVFPWFYGRALQSGKVDECDRVLNHLRRYPPVLENRRTRRMKQQWGLSDELEWDNVLEQQGAVFLYKYGCVKNNCGSCRLNRRDETDQLSLMNRRR